MEAYLVEDLVFNVILGIPPSEVTICVVGDAPALGEKVATELNGTVTPAPQFRKFPVVFKWGAINFVTAHSTIYESGGPPLKVKANSIDAHVKCGDFGITSMAVSIMPNSWGKLHDPVGSFSDCAKRQIRLLNPDHVQYQPIVAMRAARLKASLNFGITSATVEAIRQNVHHIRLVNPVRIQQELAKMLLSPQRVAALTAAEELGVWAALDPLIRIGATAMELLQNAENNGSIPYYLARISTSLNREEAEAFARGIAAPNEWREALLSSPRYKAVAPLLDEDRTASEIYSLLEGISIEGIAVQMEIASITHRKACLMQFLKEYRFIQPKLTENDLIRLGVPRGPEVKIVMRELREAKLDGLLPERKDEEGFIRGRLPTIFARKPLPTLTHS